MANAEPGDNRAWPKRLVKRPALPLDADDDMANLAGSDRPRQSRFLRRHANAVASILPRAGEHSFRLAVFKFSYSNFHHDDILRSGLQLRVSAQAGQGQPILSRCDGAAAVYLATTIEGACRNALGQSCLRSLTQPPSTITSR